MLGAAHLQGPPTRHGPGAAPYPPSEPATYATGQEVRPQGIGAQYPQQAPSLQPTALQGQALHKPLQPEQQQQTPPQHAYSTLNGVGTPATAAAAQPSQPPTPPTQKRFGIFRRRGPMPPPTSPQPLPQQTHQQAFPAPHDRSPPAGAAPPPPPPPPPAAPPHLPRDAQPMQELVGGNWIFVVFLPYFVATALQDTHLRIGLIVATASSGCVLLLGLLLFAMNMRKVFPHILELFMPIIFAVQLGVSYHSSSYEQEIIRTYPFITHSALAGVCLLSLLVCYPVGYQTAQELVHKMYMTHPAVHRVGLYTTAVLTASLVSSCLLYLAPLCKGVDDRHWSALNLIFRLIYPPLATCLALLFVRFFPDAAMPNLAVVHGLNRKPNNQLPFYLEDAMSRRPPAILDASMYQSTVDAATKAREATLMRRASPYAALSPHPLRPPLTPRYGPGGSPAASAPHGYGAPPPGYGNQLAPGYGSDVGVLPGGTEPRSVYAYYAAGPPAEPPLAVYAVYGNYDSLPLAGHPQQQQEATLLPPRVQPLTYGGAALAPNPALTRPYGKPGFAPGYNLAGRPRYMYGSAGGAPYGHGEDLYPGGMGMPGRGYVSAGGAGAYAVNMPLRAMAGDYHQGGQFPAGPRPGSLPPLRHPDAIITGQLAAAPPPQPFGRLHPPELLEPGDGGGGDGGRFPMSYQQPYQASRHGGTVPPHHTPAPMPPAGRLYAGSVSLMPAAADPYGTEYGLGPEVLQREADGRSYGIPGVAAAAPAPRPPPIPMPRFGLDAETAAAPVTVEYDIPSPIGRDAYGLAAETQPPPAPLPPQRSSPPLRQPPPSYRPPSPPGVRHMAAAVDGGGEGFGLAAEVSPSLPVRRQQPLPNLGPSSYGSPSPLGPGRRRPTAEPLGGEGAFGLDAEVGP